MTDDVIDPLDYFDRDLRNEVVRLNHELSVTDDPVQAVRIAAQAMVWTRLLETTAWRAANRARTLLLRQAQA